MPTYLVACRECGKEHEPTPATIRAGSWRVCPDCRTEALERGRCRAAVIAGPTSQHAAPVPADAFPG
jgi:hypothetical protein